MCSALTQITAESSVDITDVTTSFIGKNQLEIKGTATNNGNLASDDAVITAKAGGVPIGLLDLGRLEVGETRSFEFYGDTGAVDFDSTVSEDGAVTETAELRVCSDGNGENIDLTRSANSADMALINNISTFVLKEEDDNAVAGSITLTKAAPRRFCRISDIRPKTK